MIPMPTVFERDKSTGLVIPKLNPDCAWLHGSLKHTIITTVMLDGVTCKIAEGAGGKVLSRKIAAVQTAQGMVIPFVLCRRDCTEDAPYFEAFDALTVAAPGLYVVYGPNIGGNPQKVSKHIMLRINPVDNCLILFGTQSGIDRVSTVERFYETCKQALAEGDAYGVVFQVEEPSFTLKAWAKLKRTDFGLPWPIPEPPKATDRKCMFFNCTNRIPLSGPVYCEPCREGNHSSTASRGREVKACEGAGCQVLLAVDGPAKCSDCRNKIGHAVGFLTGNSAIPSA